MQKVATRSIGRRALAAVGMVLLVMIGAHLEICAATAPPAEEKLIEELIRQVADMRDVVFIRNGMEYSAKEAADHLHEKFLYFRSDIHTADDFIRLCATRSEMTGLPYHVRDAKGVMHESAALLHLRLDALRSSAATPGAVPGPAAPTPTPAAAPSH